MFMGLSRYDAIRQYMSDNQLGQTVVGYNTDGTPIYSEEIPTGVTPDTAVQAAIMNAPDLSYSDLTDVQQAIMNAPTPLTPVQQAIMNAPSIPPSPVSNSTPTSAADIAKAVNQVVTTGLQTYQAVQLQQMQVDRLNKGLPPLTVGQMASIMPQLGYNYGYPGSSNNGLMMLLLIGGGALLLLAMSKKKAHG